MAGVSVPIATGVRRCQDQEMPAHCQVVRPRNLHCDPAERSPAVKGGPAGPSAASRAAAPLTGGVQRSYW